MEIDEALNKVYAQKELDEKLKDKYLCSALSFLHEWKSPDAWELNFYDKETNKIIQVTADDEPHIKAEGAPFKPKVGEISEIKTDDLKISAARALDIAKEHYDEKFKSVEIQKIFFALHGGDKPYWSASVITKHLTIVIIDVDSVDGEIKKSKVHTIFDKKGASS